MEWKDRGADEAQCISYVKCLDRVVVMYDSHATVIDTQPLLVFFENQLFSRVFIPLKDDSMEDDSDDDDALEIKIKLYFIRLEIYQKNYFSQIVKPMMYSQEANKLIFFLYIKGDWDKLGCDFKMVGLKLSSSSTLQAKH
ncbi:unnamed protein product [Dovyalis caffra]|uniref:Uncharacterized protein n=1 Tax=Dovyalis caffra TaxID=77055 RepID=A0AAV1SDT0_9ROSI|nr:unnamed protein product [Dovyalis caffra]